MSNPSSRLSEAKVRAIAFYLPQFHPIPENDNWWGEGFTEWTNVAKAKPLFRGHLQPQLPADLGFYDLRVPEVREAQARLAREAGIEGFCYWHYWFAGKRLLERPFNEVLKSGEPNFPFCLAWANQTWSGVWHGNPKRILIEQTYPGSQDHERHFHAILPAFHDHRYIRVRDKPLFVVYRPTELPNLKAYIAQWQELALRNGLKGIHFVSHQHPHHDPLDWEGAGFSGVTPVAALKVTSMSLREILARRASRRAGNPSTDGGLQFVGRLARHAARRLWQRISRHPRSIYYYEDAMMFFLDGCQPKPNCYPCVIPNWDNSPRSGTRGVVLHGSTPQLFRQHLREALQLVQNREPEDRVIFLKSWNEWAEGNYLEPDQRFGRMYLNAVREEVVLPPTSESALLRSTVGPQVPGNLPHPAPALTENRA